MKQISNSWTKLLVLMLITASAVVLLAVAALADSPSARADSVQAPAVPTVPTPPPSAIYISTSHNAKIDKDANNPDYVRFKREDILRCVIGSNGKCIWDVFLHGSAIGLSGVNIRDFEVLVNGDILFVIDRKKTLPGAGAVTPRDVIRYNATTGAFSVELVGSTIGLTKSNENIDALAITPTGHLVISTFGSATINGISGKVHDRDLVEINGTTGSLYFDGSAVGLTKSSEDVSAAWIGNPSPDQNIYLATKGKFSVDSVNQLHGKKSDIFGCSPTSFGPIHSCFFYSFFQGEPSGLDNQIDGISVATTGPIASAAVSAAIESFKYSVVSDDVDADNSIDAETFAEATSQNDPEITAEDFMNVVQELYLPMVASH